MAFPEGMPKNPYGLIFGSLREKILERQMVVAAAIHQNGTLFTVTGLCNVVTGKHYDPVILSVINELIKQGILAQKDDNTAKRVFALSSMPCDMTRDIYMKSINELNDIHIKMQETDKAKKKIVHAYNENGSDAFQSFPVYPAELTNIRPTNTHANARRREVTLRNQIVAAGMSYHAVGEEFSISHLARLVERQDTNVGNIVAQLADDGYFKHTGRIKNKNLYMMDKKPSDITEESYYKMIRTFPVIAGRWGEQIDDILYQRQISSEMKNNLVFTQ